MRNSYIVLAMITLLTLGASQASAVDTQRDVRESIRLFVEVGEEKQDLVGRHWLALNNSQKIEMVERARRAALSLGALMTLPAELYIKELDRMYSSLPSVSEIGVGQAIQGIAIYLKDWQAGTGEVSEG